MQFSNLYFGHSLSDLIIMTFQGQTLLLYDGLFYHLMNLVLPSYPDWIYIVACQGGGLSSKTRRRSADKTRSLYPLFR